jgi:hypothetical protein
MTPLEKKQLELNLENIESMLKHAKDILREIKFLKDQAARIRHLLKADKEKIPDDIPDVDGIKTKLESMHQIYINLCMAFKTAVLGGAMSFAKEAKEESEGNNAISNL